LAPSLATARELVLTYGWNSTVYQILNPGIDHWFTADSSAVVGYTRRGRVLLAAGAPVCAPGRLAETCARFEAFARRQGCAVCYVCAGGRMRNLLEHSERHSLIALGAQPVWDPRDWPAFLRRQAPLRRQLNRSRNKAVEVEALDPVQAAQAPAIHALFSEWLQNRPLPPLRFLASPDVLGGCMRDRVFLVAKRHDRVVAFLAASPVPARNGYLVEVLARSQAAPNGTAELLIDAAMRRFALESSGYVTLGLVALARAADREIRSNPAWMRGLMRFARAHANRFYHFRGLEHFRAKLGPQCWEPVYAISNERRFSPGTLYAMGSAFSEIAPWLAVGIGLARAAGAEWNRAVASLLQCGRRSQDKPHNHAGACIQAGASVR
jgi:phosphatidylglycerol lysyltransferase